MTDPIAAYVTPGVYVQEVPYPTQISILVSPTIVALVGDSQAFRVGTEVIQLSDALDESSVVIQPAYQLSKLGINAATIKVTDRSTGQVYAGPEDNNSPTATGAGDDFDIEQGPGPGGGSAGSSGGITTIKRVESGDIAGGSPASGIGGAFITVTYEYADPDYYTVQSFTDYDNLKDQYGEPFDTTGAVNSELSLGALLAFRNGASTVVAVAVQRAGVSPTLIEWQTAIDKLQNETGVNVVVPLVGDATIGIAVHAYLLDHCNLMATQGIMRRGFVGRDGTVAAVSVSDFQTAASSIRSTRMTLVAPDVFDFNTGIGTKPLTLGGHYAAAAVAGNHASRPVQIPLTRKQIFSFVDIPNQHTSQDRLIMQSSGVCVLYQRRDGTITVAHGVTTDMTDRYTREISVQAAKDRLRDLLQDTLEGSSLIGGILDDNAPDLVVGAVTGALEFAKGTELIQDYSDVKWRIPLDDPTTIQVTFQYLPSVPLNYVQVLFAINTQTGTLSFQETGVSVLG